MDSKEDNKMKEMDSKGDNKMKKMDRKGDNKKMKEIIVDIKESLGEIESKISSLQQ